MIKNIKKLKLRNLLLRITFTQIMYLKFLFVEVIIMVSLLYTLINTIIKYRS